MDRLTGDIEMLQFLGSRGAWVCVYPCGDETYSVGDGNKVLLPHVSTEIALMQVLFKHFSVVAIFD